MTNDAVKNRAEKIIAGLGLDTVGTIEVLDERMNELSFGDIQTLMAYYGCGVAKITDTIFAVHVQGKGTKRKR